MLAFAVLLVSGLMAISEAPEILTLTDNVANDCESVQVVRQNRPQGEDSIGQMTSERAPISAYTSDRGGTQRFLSSPPRQSSPSLLLLLVTQRK